MTKPDTRKVAILFNRRHYHPGEWEVWYQSEVIAHSRSLEDIQECYPNAVYKEIKHA